jgi:predicted GIY-YIG superfamily endonuclease
MDKKFIQHIESLKPALQRLIAMKPVHVTALPGETPRSAVYLFSEESRHLYVGRTDRLKGRLQEHCRPSSHHNSAAFAFRLAREVTEQLAASYLQERSRRSLAEEPAFGQEFVRAKEKVRRMEVRWVEEVDPVKQALLEIYAAVVLETPYNDFRNH